MAGVVYQVDANGHAPKGAGVGDYVKTNGGVYEILDGSQYSNLSKESLASAGVGYNPATGLYSKKVNDSVLSSSANQYGPTSVNFDLEGWKQAYINNAVGKLEANYADDLASLSKTHNKNVSTYQEQATNINDQYNDAVSDLAKQSYINNVLTKQQASKQGLTSSAQGIAMAQNVLSSANEQSTSLWDSRERTLASIERAINDLTANFNIDKDTLKSRLNANKLSAMSDADLQALDRELSLLTTNIANENQWNLARYQTENSNQQAQRDREFQEYLTLLGFDQEDKWKARELAAKRASGGPNSELKIDAKYETALVDNYVEKLESEGQTGNLTAGEVKIMHDLYTKVEYGKASASDYITTVGQMLAKKQEIDSRKSLEKNKNSKQYTPYNPWEWR